MMDLLSYDTKNLTMQYNLNVKVGYSAVAILNVIGEAEDDKAGFQCLRQAVDKILNSQGMQQDH